MIITYQGDTYFKIQSGSFVLLIDPQNSRSFKGANVILNTTKPTAVASPEKGADFFWAENQGEYEVGGMMIEGWAAGYKDKKTAKAKTGQIITAYRFKMEDIEIGVIGPISEDPGPEVLEKMQGVDILILPGSGTPLLKEVGAVKLARQIEPGIVIPSGNGSNKFFRELSQKPAPQEKFVIKKKELVPGAISAVCLKS